MSWRDRYQRGSYKGVTFFTQSVKSKVGHRNVIMHAPFVAGAYSQALGRKAREFSIEACFLGEDYDADRDALIDVLESSPSGLLVHPYLGRHYVTIDGGVAELEESTAEGGRCKISFTAIETAENPALPELGLDSGTAALYSANRALEEARSSTIDNLSVNGAVQFVQDAGVEDTTSLLDDARNLAADIDQVLQTPGNYVAAFESMVFDVVDLVNTPGNLFDRFESELGRMLQAVDVLADTIGGLLPIVDRPMGSSVVEPDYQDTPSRQAQARNARAIRHVGRAILLPSIVKQIVNLVGAVSPADDGGFQIAPRGLDSTTKTRAVADKIREKVQQTIEEDTPDDSSALALSEMVTELDRFLSRVAIGLPDDVSHEIGQDLPAAVVSQQLYGNARRAGDIVTRNELAHALVVPGGIILQVLSNDQT